MDIWRNRAAVLSTIARSAIAGRTPVRDGMGRVAKISEGSQLGRFTLVRRIDDERGGNCNVWLAESDGTQYAVKVLRNTNRKERFLQEIEFLRTRPTAGVLPLLASNLDGDVPLWYAMPLATPLRKAIVEQGLDAQRVIEIFAAYAETLAALADQGVHHRDLKPDNLFIDQAEAAIGDFGLVAYPEKAPLTQPEERVGPLGFFAPEMIHNTDQAEYGPADVWAFMNALWVALVSISSPEVEYPPPGPHRDEPDYDLRPRVDHPRMSELNSLMRRATRMQPAARPTMEHIARELRAYLEPPIEARPEADDSDLQARLAELVASEDTGAQQMKAATHAHLIDQFRLLVGSHFGEVSLAIQQRLPPTFGYSEAPRGEVTGEIIRRFGNAREFVFDMRGDFVSPAPDTRARAAYSVAAVRTDDDGPVHLGAAFRVYEVFGGLEYTCYEWPEPVIRSMALDVEKLEPDLAALKARVLGDCTVMLRELTKILARSPGTPPPPVGSQ